MYLKWQIKLNNFYISFKFHCILFFQPIRSISLCLQMFGDRIYLYFHLYIDEKSCHFTCFMFKGYITWNIAGELHVHLYILCIVFNAPIIVSQNLLLLQSTNHTHNEIFYLLFQVLLKHHHRHQQTYYILYIYVRTFMRARKKFVFLQACGYARENRNYLIDRFMYSLYYHKMAQMMSVCSSLLLIWWQVLIFFYK